MNKKYQLAIQSAQTVSALRAIAVQEKDPAVKGADYLARNFLSDSYDLLIRLMPHRLMKAFVQLRAPGSYCFMIARTRHFDQTLLKEIKAGVQQVVLLGAGYDTRAFRFGEQLAGIRVYEVDFPGTQRFKKQRLTRMGKPAPTGITFIPLDFNRKLFNEALERNGFSPRLKTLFLWEGVSYYLPQPVVEQVLNYVGICAPGSSILFDYALRSFVAGDHNTYGGRQLAAWLKRIKEPFLFGLDAPETRSFIEGCHLTLRSDHSPEDLEALYLQTTRGRLLGRTLGHVRMVHAGV